MSQFPFKPEKYCQYRNTFLQKVTIGFDFAPSGVEKSKLNALFNEYVQSFFGVTSDGDLTSITCSVSKNDQSLSFDFCDHSAVINLSGRNYVGFSDTAIPQIFKLRDFFNKVVQIENFKRTGIRKLNVFNIKTNGKEQVDEIQVMKAIFSEELNSKLSNDNLDGEEQNAKVKKCILKSGNKTITIRTALMPPSRPNDLFYHLLLDTLGEIENEDGITVEEVSELLMDFNKDIYDCFHWCVNDRVKQVMQQSDINNRGKEINNGR